MGAIVEDADEGVAIGEHGVGLVVIDVASVVEEFEPVLGAGSGMIGFDDVVLLEEVSDTGGGDEVLLGEDVVLLLSELGEMLVEAYALNGVRLALGIDVEKLSFGCVLHNM